MRKINVRSPFYISGDQEIEPVILPDPYFYHTATECGGSTTVSVRSTTELTNGQGIKVNGYGDTCFEVTGTLTETNETDVTFIYDTCDKCNDVPDYNYYTAELCAGGSPINVRSVNTLTVGQVIKAENFSADCYTITGSGSSNTNTVVTLFNSCDHCATGIDYTYYDANSCDGTSSVVVRYEGALPSGTPVINVSGQGNKCFVLDGVSDETSTNDITAFYQSCVSCEPVDPYTYYTATECGGSATVDFKSNETLAIGSSVTLDGYGTTCYEVTSVGSVSGIAWTNKYADCTACANANDPYNYFDAQKCDGTGAVIKIASINELSYMQPRLWKASGQDDTCFSILSQTTSGGTVYNATEVCPTCPTEDPYKYWKATKCGGTTVTYFRSLVDMTNKVVKFTGDTNCYTVNNEVFTTNTKDWSEIFSDCTTCQTDGLVLNEINLLTKFDGEDITGKTVSYLNTQYKCRNCNDSIIESLKGYTEQVPMAVGHQLYNQNKTKSTLSGVYVSNSTSTSSLNASICNKGVVVFPLIYTFSNGKVTAVTQGDINNCFEQPNNSLTKELFCGETYNQSSAVGLQTYNVYNGYTGTFEITISGNEIPCKFTIEWNGSEVADTGYIGSSDYDDQLLANGVSAGDINTSTPSNKSGTLSFNKTSAYPNLITIKVFTPLLNDNYSIELSQCPTPSTFTGDVNTNISVHSNDVSTKAPNAIYASAVVENKPNYLYPCLDTDFYQPLGGTAAGKLSKGFTSYGIPWLDYRQICYKNGASFSIKQINNIFLDNTKEFKLYNVNDYKSRLDFIKRNFNIYTNIRTVFYLVNNGTSDYTALVAFFNYLITTESALKWYYDNGIIEIVYNVNPSQNYFYHVPLIANKLNTFNGFNLGCTIYP